MKLFWIWHCMKFVRVNTVGPIYHFICQQPASSMEPISKRLKIIEEVMKLLNSPKITFMVLVMSSSVWWNKSHIMFNQHFQFDFVLEFVSYWPGYWFKTSRNQGLKSINSHLKPLNFLYIHSKKYILSAPHVYGLFCSIFAIRGTAWCFSFVMNWTLLCLIV